MDSEVDKVKHAPILDADISSTLTSSRGDDQPGLESDDVQNPLKPWFIWNQVCLLWYWRFRDNTQVWDGSFPHTAHWGAWSKVIAESSPGRLFKYCEVSVGEDLGLEFPMDFVLLYHRQIQDLRLVAYDHTSLARVLDQHFDNLNELIIYKGFCRQTSGDIDYDCMNVDIDVATLGHALPRLVSLELRGVFLPIDRLSLCSSLTQLFAYWTNETTLGPVFQVISIREILHALSHRPLTSLALHATILPDSELQLPVTLPFLEILDVAGTEGSIDIFLHAIDTPALTSLSVDFHFPPRDVDDIAAICAIQRASMMIPPLPGEAAKFYLIHHYRLVAHVHVLQGSSSPLPPDTEPLLIHCRHVDWFDVDIALILLESLRGRPVILFVWSDLCGLTANSAASWYRILELTEHTLKVELTFRGDPNQNAFPVECLGLFQVLGRTSDPQCYWTLQETSRPSEQETRPPWPWVQCMTVHGSPSEPELLCLLSWLSRKATCAGQRPPVNLTFDGQWADELLAFRTRFEQVARLDWKVTPQSYSG